MKRMIAWLSVCALLFCSCGIRADFVISASSSASTGATESDNSRIWVLINKNTKKYHTDPDCVYTSGMAEENRLELRVKNEEYLLEMGYSPCAKCSGNQ